MRKKGNPKKLTKKAKKKLSAVSIQNLRILSEQIGNIIPATSFRKGGFCFQTIAKKSGFQKYWANQGSKKELIFNFLKKIYQKHPRTFYKIFRENFAQGIERRHKAGSPVLRNEINLLNNTLGSLGINLSKEIEELDLPEERPKFVPPLPQFQKMIDELSLHSFLQPDCTKLFKDGHVNESARKALEKYEVFVQQKSTLNNLQGKNLMANAFNEQNPLVKIADISCTRGKSLQEGFKFLSMGAMEFWRNYFSHGDEEQISNFDAIAILSTVSHLLYYIDQNQT